MTYCRIYMTALSFCLHQLCFMSCVGLLKTWRIIRQHPKLLFIVVKCVHFQLGISSVFKLLGRNNKDDILPVEDRITGNSTTLTISPITIYVIRKSNIFCEFCGPIILILNIWISIINRSWSAQTRVKCTVTLSINTTPWESGGRAPHILNLSSERKWVAGFKLRPLYTR